jgi:hypothetical protein
MKGGLSAAFKHHRHPGLENTVIPATEPISSTTWLPETHLLNEQNCSGDTG